ncbi:4'-phosphopantetheinyl transferase superfamily protein [Thalassobaculum sp. OXR-137]|uniref:4'-phosphopantetheinyl transferase family protein n=1 Tax=Thalassobaculum sp. OXR-137 TaxID=3100173 RepID=UPI002AC8BCB6|nr:4'-phosphopantetheinyl transferase superfamily protein [Thalassobaculum sp. OXR-137]WPZ32697.1 4'-phosphopantetheinyl transferase superfamily protein [Thalassobaculum sp. OXR-137]
MPRIRVHSRSIAGLREADLEAERALLDEAERERAGRFVFESGRVEFTAVHALVRTLLGRELGADPRALRFVAQAYGKPAVWLDGAPAPVSFNLSHTAGMVAVAVGPADMALGVDVENGERAVDLSIAESYFAPIETAWLMAKAEPDRRRAFTTLWTLKEAFIKATGKGLSQELDRFWFADPSQIPIRIGFRDEDAGQADEWRFEHRILGEHHHLSVGWRGPGEVEWID